MSTDRFLNYVEMAGRALRYDDYVRCMRILYFCDLTPYESRIVRRAIRLNRSPALLPAS